MEYIFPKITTVFLNLTNACNLACRYCFVEQHPNYMSLDVAKDAARFLAENAKETGATPGITFFGGEPMLCYDTVIKPLCEFIRAEYPNFSLTMTTNGTLLDVEKLDFLAEHGVSIMVSIDGDKETQDYNRPLHGGKGSFRLLEPIIPEVLKRWPTMTFRSTLIPKTCGHLFENILFAERTGYTNLFAIPNVFEDWSDEDKATVEAELRKYSNYFITRFQSDGECPIKFSPLEEAMRKIIDINQAVCDGLCQGCHTGYQKCGLGAGGFGSVDYKGNLYACQEMCSCKGDGDPFYIGNIYDGVDDDRRRALLASFDAGKLQGDDCQNCPMRRICDGGCVANNYLRTGDMNCVPTVYCWWLKTLLNEAIYIMNKLGNSECEAFRTYWSSLQRGGRRQCPNLLNEQTS